MISIVRPPWPNNFALAILLATPIATALSRNIAFPMLLLATALFVLTSVQTNGVAKSWTTLKQFVCHFITSSSVGPLAIAIIVFALVSLSWAPEISRGLGALSQTTVAALAAVVCCLLIARQIGTPKWVVWVLPLAVTFACLLILIELRFGSPIRLALGASPEPFRLNRAAVAIALFAPILFLLNGSGKYRFVTIFIAALALTTIFLSQSESAKLAVVAIAATAAVSQVMQPRSLLLCVGVAIIASHAFAPAIALALHARVTPDAVASLLSAFTTEDYHFIRLEIWRAYAQQIIDAPFFGHGLQGSFWAQHAYGATDAIVLRGLSFTHPHSASLQTWYELGLIGIVLTVALMVLFLRQILCLPEPCMRIAVIVMAGVWSVAYVSHGAWQAWWWALVGIVSILLLAASRLDRSNAS